MMDWSVSPSNREGPGSDKFVFGGATVNVNLLNTSGGFIKVDRRSTVVHFL